ncbi:putative zinc binding protein [Mumia flava]|uniref:Putative zinc binding protein n=1 Tax=Mumia flava TaxID=1348852 RepID=A0A2M9BFZ0_9ACTN|nr:transferase [Mumia flava]PJJ56852.1 putative zinc binding protein [Mumia flava]
MSAETSLPSPIESWRDRWSGEPGGVVVLDLGSQPASDLFPAPDDPLPDPEYPLRMVMSTTSGLLQLEDDPTEPEEPLGVEPRALVEQAEKCVADLTEAGFVVEGTRFVDYPSPHGGSWTPQLTLRGAEKVASGPADLVVDVHGMMHDRDQLAAFRERVDHLDDDGVIAFMIHNVASIVRVGMWNALKSGHFAYYSTPALVSMAAELGLTGVGAWQYPLYQDGTTMLVFARTGSRWGEQAASVTAMIERETAEGIDDPAYVATLGEALETSVAAIRGYLDDAAKQGLVVGGYGAASRTSSLLRSAEVNPALLAAVADAATGKHGLTMPTTRVPIVSPQALVDLRPDRVLLFVPDLLPEVRKAMPQIEENGGRWVVMDPMPREIEPA